MVEREPESAIGSALRAGRSGVLASAPGVQIRQVQPTAMLQISGASANEKTDDALTVLGPVQLPARLQFTSGEGVRALWNGPGRFLITVDGAAPEGLAGALLDGAEVGELACVDVGHAWSVLRLQGPRARDLLAKGCAVDVDQMAAHSCRPTAVGRFDVLLCCIEDDGFDLFVARSFAHSFAHWLLRAGAEFGVIVSD